MRVIYLKFFLLICLYSFVAIANVSSRDKEHKEYDDLSIIMPSYDKNSELWDPAFNLLFKNWPSILNEYNHVPLYLVSNSEKFEHPRVTNILVGDIEKGWSNNFLKALQNVKTKYVLIILDDYIITEPVNDKRLAEILKLIRETNGAYAEIALDPILNDGHEVYGYSGIIKRSKFGEVRTSLQTCIWETNILKWLLKPDENIWEFEEKGTHRSEGVMQDFYLTTADPVFIYLNAMEKGKYIKEVVGYINQQGIKFAPIKAQIISKPSILPSNNENALNRGLLYKLKKILYQ